MTDYLAFTKKESDRVAQLKTDVTIMANNRSTQTIGLWDTGATGSCLSEDVITSLGLIPTGKRQVLSPTGGDEVNTYYADIMLPNRVIVKDVVVTNSAIGLQGIGMLIGMDIISLGDFAVTTHDRKTTFSFVIPSMQEVDFVPKSKMQNTIHQSHRKKKK